MKNGIMVSLNERIDFDTLADDTVTVRDRDTAKQERIKVENLKKYIKEKIN